MALHTSRYEAQNRVKFLRGEPKENLLEPKHKDRALSLPLGHEISSSLKDPCWSPPSIPECSDLPLTHCSVTMTTERGTSAFAPSHGCLDFRLLTRGFPHRSSSLPQDILSWVNCFPPKLTGEILTQTNQDVPLFKEENLIERSGKEEY